MNLMHNRGWRESNQTRREMSPLTKALLLVGGLITLMVVVGGGLTIGLDWVISLVE